MKISCEIYFPILLELNLLYRSFQNYFHELHQTVFVFLCCWHIWKHQNDMVFDNQ